MYTKKIHSFFFALTVITFHELHSFHLPSPLSYTLSMKTILPLMFCSFVLGINIQKWCIEVTKLNNKREYEYNFSSKTGICTFFHKNAESYIAQIRSLDALKQKLFPAEYELLPIEKKVYSLPTIRSLFNQKIHIKNGITKECSDLIKKWSEKLQVPICRIEALNNPTQHSPLAKVNGVSKIIFINMQRWDKLSPDGKNAIVLHELSHIRLFHGYNAHYMPAQLVERQAYTYFPLYAEEKYKKTIRLHMKNFYSEKKQLQSCGSLTHPSSTEIVAWLDKIEELDPVY